MKATDIIRASVAEVAEIRRLVAQDPKRRWALSVVKSYQSLRFEHSYRDLIAGGPYRSAALLFLNELYGVADFSQRDAQFSKIAGAIERLLPEQAVGTAVALAQLHLLTEQLDHAMADAWPQVSGHATVAEQYVSAWRVVSQPAQRQHQLQLVLGLGRDLERLTRIPGLRLMLKMMRRPAQAAGLAELQHFLELGFDTFAGLAKKTSGVSQFLELIQARETQTISALFDPLLDVTQAIQEGMLPMGSEAGLY